MSSSNGHALPNLMATLPDFLPSYVLSSCSEWPCASDGIQELRLVSKEIGAIAETAITACTLEVGGDPCIAPERVAQLVRSARLNHLTVTVKLSEGEDGSRLHDGGKIVCRS